MIGQSLAHYRITAALGAGGMGEVYRASDSRLSREVAIKVLPREVADDPERLARFRREAQLVASLNHPNVGAIYGLEEADGKPFLVLELVEGETLADRLQRGAPPVAEALEIARQISEGVGAAHDKGVVHRDLKPANVKLTPEGQVKVLDFGLARASELDGASASGPSLSHSPTLAAPGTDAGLILGTAAYMSPEQARGKRVDKRADIWAFGVIVWEMLTGQRLFAGDTVSDVLAAVLRADLDWRSLPPGTPAALERLLRRCLERDPNTRLHDIADARLEIAEALACKPETAAAALPQAGASRARLLPWGLFAAAALAAATLVVPAARHASEQPSLVSFELHPPAKGEFQLLTTAPGPPVVSPDGRSLVFSALSEGQPRLFVRALDAAEPRVLAGTEGAQYPFWSPDGRSIGFFADAKLKRVDAKGGAPFTLCDVPDGKGASWSRGGVILFAKGPSTPLEQVSENGGTASRVTELDTARNDDSHRHPRFLPDGRRFLYLARNPGGGLRGDNVVMAGSLDGGPHKLVVRSPAMAEYVDGRLLYLRERTLMAQPFDVARLELVGEAVPVAQDVRALGTTALALFGAAADTLVYQQGQGGAERKLVWRDRQGRLLGTLGDPGRYTMQVSLSPGGNAAAVPVMDPATGNADIWTYDVARGVRSRFSFDPRPDSSPVFSPDGGTIVYASFRQTRPGLYRKPFEGAGGEELILEVASLAHPSGFSPDGRTLVYSQRNETTGWDVWTVGLVGEPKPTPLLNSPHLEACAVLSPDGRFLAYCSDESGRPEVYVMPYPASGRKWQVSVQGGVFPRWRKDARELVYQAFDGTVVAVETAVTGSGFTLGAGRTLFRTRNSSAHEYVLWPTPDAQRFLVVEPVEQESPRPFTVVLGWQRALNR